MAGFIQGRVLHEPNKVDARLREMGLSATVLLSALNAGIASLALASPNHPPNFGGTSLWAEAVRVLRELLIPKGWRKDNSYNFPTVVSPDRKIAVAVASGDEGTGIRKGNPSTHYPRGTVMQRRVEANSQLPLFDDIRRADDAESAEEAEATWMLLHYRERGQLRCELSLPISINDSGFVENWAERIILTPIQIDPTRMPVLDDEPVNPTVTVKRRAS